MPNVGPPLSNPYNETAHEAGYPLPEVPRQDELGLPPGGGKSTLPHFLTFSAIVNYASRTYRFRFDEAMRHNVENAKAMRRDPVVMDALRTRQMAAAQLSWHLEADDDTDPRQADALSDTTAIINRIPRFQQLRMQIAESRWFGRSGAQVMYAWDFSSGKRRLVVRDHLPINGDKLVFTFGGEAGVLVHGSYTGDYRITERGKAHFFTPQEREALIVARFEPEDSDFYDGELGGAIHGTGIRGRIYWLWWLRQQVQTWMMDYLERVGAGGFTIYYFDAGNKQSLAEVKEAAEEQFRNNTILFPRRIDSPNAGSGVQRIEPSMAGAQLLQELITEYFDGIIRRYILGQSVESSDANMNIGTGEADFKAATLSRITKYDALYDQETLTQDLVKVLVKYNHPGCENHIRFVFDVDKPNAVEYMEGAKAFYEMGGEIDADDLRSILGLGKPKPGHAVLSKVPAMSPTAMDQTPQGVPIAGQPGPQQVAPQQPQGEPAAAEGNQGPVLQ